MLHDGGEATRLGWPLFLICLVGLGCTDRADVGKANGDPASGNNRGPGMSVSGKTGTGGSSSSPAQQASEHAGSRVDSDAIQLVYATPNSGIDFKHQSGSRGQFLLPETMTGGVAVFDFNSDGREDIFFCNGGSLTGGDRLPGPALYRNLHAIRFDAVSKPSGVSLPAFGLGVTIGDYNNDGFPDLYLCNFGANCLMRNNGDGTFDRIADQPSLSVGSKFSAGATFLDVNNDGNLDLFVANYVQLSPDQLESQIALQRTRYPGPQDFPPEENALLVSQGDDTWIDQSNSSKIGSVRGTGMGCVSGDFDADGDVDIYVANDEMPNYLFRNEGQGTFAESAVEMGAAVDGNGHANGSMGVECSDFDNDGRWDLFITTFENETVKLFRMMNTGISFQDVTRSTQIGELTLPHVTWGCCAIDLENDGDRDLFVASGHLDQRSGQDYFIAKSLLMKNLHRETKLLKFKDITESGSDLKSHRGCARGAAVSDLDDDGDLDLVVLNRNDAPGIYENRSKSGKWIEIKLVGTSCNRDAVGARVVVKSERNQWVDERRNGRGYQSYWGDRLHFGLGEDAAVSVEVAWPDGQKQMVKPEPKSNRLQIVQEPGLR